MTLDFVKNAYLSKRSGNDDLEDAIEQVFNNPTEESDKFFFSIFKNSDLEEHPFWINQAITYSNRAKDKVESQKLLEGILENLPKYWFLGAALPSAAIQLGRLAKYPNNVLGKAIEIPYNCKDEVDNILLRAVHIASYGAYIMTATDFPTGWNAKSELEISETEPTLEMAENFIKTTINQD